ncbi:MULTISPECIES: hypothetical protein [Burkholderiaceae]|uniref:hypothetical protein n=1 Tax=Burkholderiaceae TaxID=119060 RepID=UPI0009687556|nr:MULTISPECIES: hypothetical protein [Burkholderiaceae]MCG1019340.1 hypothetical protein [Mycetohabitans sp. B4]SIT66983.1 hypothetical protein SAMN04487768_1026 [Burkholderia sp. b13]
MQKKAKRWKKRRKANVDENINVKDRELVSYQDMMKNYNGEKQTLHEVASILGAWSKRTRLMHEVDKRIQLFKEWVTGEQHQSVSMHVLGRLRGEHRDDPHTGVYNWLQNMRKIGQEPANGTYLNINPPSKWAGAINHGWLQGAIDRGNIFYLVTPVPQEVVTIHNATAQNPTEENVNIYKDILKVSGWEHWDTIYAKELILCARNRYFIHGDESDIQICSGAAP